MFGGVSRVSGMVLFVLLCFPQSDWIFGTDMIQINVDMGGF